MKKLKLRKWVKVVLVILFISALVIALKNIDDDFMNGCKNAGYSQLQCEEAR